MNTRIVSDNEFFAELEMQLAEERKLTQTPEERKLTTFLPKIDAIELINTHSQRTNMRVASLLEEFGTDSILKTADPKLSVSFLQDYQTQYERLGDAVSLYDVEKMQQKNNLLFDRLDRVLGTLRLSGNSPKNSPMRIDSPRRDLRKSSSNLSFPSLDTPFAALHPNSKEHFSGRLRSFLEKNLFGAYGIPLDENADPVLCSFDYKNTPRYFTNQNVDIVGIRPAVAKWTFEGKEYFALYQGSGSNREKQPGFYEIEIKKRFELYRQTVKAEQHAEYLSIHNPVTIQGIDDVIQKFTIPVLMEEIEKDYGFLDFYLLPNSTIPRNAYDFYKYVIGLNSTNFKYNVSKYIYYFLNTKFRSALIFSNWFAGEVTPDDILSELVFEYLLHIEVWTSIEKDIAQTKLIDYMKLPEVIDADFQDFLNFEPEKREQEITILYRKTLSSYPPGLRFLQSKFFEIPTDGSLRDILGKCLRPLVVLEDLSDYAFFLKAQLRSGYFVISQFYNYTENELVMIFPELVFKILAIAKESPDKARNLLKESTDLFDSLLGSKIEKVYKILTGNRSISILTPDIIKDSKFWKDNTMIPLEDEQSREALKIDQSVILGLQANTLSYAVVRKRNDDGVNMLDKDAYIAFLGKFIITHRSVRGVETIAYTPIEEVLNNYIQQKDTKEGKTEKHFKNKLYNCLVKMRFDMQNARKRGREEITAGSSESHGLQDD